MTTVDVVASHILKHLPNHAKPLFVAVQGPQGSGKTYLSAQLRNYLTSHPHNLRTALLSIDDLYLPHSKLVELAQSQPPNPLWQGRGPPGTHDVELGIRVLSSLKDGVQDVEIPRFDKSLHDGQGDRLPMDGSGVVIKQPPPMDVVILEGWCVGFHPITQSELENRWDGIWKEEREKLGLPGGSLCSRNDVERINKALISYGQLWNFFNVFIEIKPSYNGDSPLLSRHHIVYQWRLEQERHMRAKNGGKGMPDDAVKEFVDRYIPGYVFFGDVSSNAETNPQKWLGKSLTVVINNQRELQRAVEF
ncbi:hypothetical protein AGABI1DRAFT_71924 [Agaricus bisporus var. burnettii JB137-S8]|uniref:P-loop containing nucleoside triphosphate hydrolase protein n=1 Tax=Agaricus bisporus var. burnettii (strain JB137-S8 / ATCC MYA-4627 / FGSC 10392) TaxID=597362 RepID=K5XDA1_AGABU|nr:uncharacterized protein AGABI1DRAFT_71924 [Agaricus bisporus var. burnettii JB137-S8]EKM81117.1 hypothetical protein AGABI1DRAFT_71924 [Agaricus bisporus var. burnettii JB137-S8]